MEHLSSTGARSVDLQSTPNSVAPGRIPVARMTEGPGGVDWFIDAMLVNGGPAYLLRPCVRFAFVPSQVHRVATGLASSLAQLQLRPKLRDPGSLDDAMSELDAGREPTEILELRDPDVGAEDRREVLDATPWTLLDQPPSALGMGELADMDRVDAALIALLDARRIGRGPGRRTGAGLPTPRADLVDVLVRGGLPPVDAASRVEQALRTSGSLTLMLMRERETGVRARRRGPRSVVVSDPDGRGVGLVDWLRAPRTARLLRVVMGGQVEGLHVGIADPPTLDGWMASRSLPFRIERVPITPGQRPPVGLPPEDIDRDAGTMTLYGFAATREGLVGRGRALGRRKA